MRLQFPTIDMLIPIVEQEQAELHASLVHT